MEKNHLIVILIACIVTASGGYFVAYKQYGGNVCTISEKRCALRTGMRKLWSDHVFWTRNYIISALADAPNTSAVADRLLHNQQDIGDAMVPYYGKEAGQQLTDLLKAHILIATEVVAAAKTNNKEKLQDADQRWHANVVEIAEFLSAANPNWPKEALIEMLNTHLKLTTAEVVSQLNKDWKEDIATFDNIVEQALDMADHFTLGIVTQFPH